MATRALTLLLFGLFAASSGAWAQSPAATEAARAREAQALLGAKNCLACHAVGKKIVGPSLTDIAQRHGHASDSARLALEAKVLRGGAGAWGPVPMPANPSVSPEQARELVGYILAQKSAPAPFTGLPGAP